MKEGGQRWRGGKGASELKREKKREYGRREGVCLSICMMQCVSAYVIK